MINIIKVKATGNSRRWLKERDININFLSLSLTLIFNIIRRKKTITIAEIKLRIIPEAFSEYEPGSSILGISEVSFINPKSKQGRKEFFYAVLHEFSHYIQCEHDSLPEYMFADANTISHREYLSNPTEKQARQLEKLADVLILLYNNIKRAHNQLQNLKKQPKSICEKNKKTIKSKTSCKRNKSCNY